MGKENSMNLLTFSTDVYCKWGKLKEDSVNLLTFSTDVYCKWHKKKKWSVWWNAYTWGLYSSWKTGRSHGFGQIDFTTEKEVEFIFLLKVTESPEIIKKNVQVWVSQNQKLKRWSEALSCYRFSIPPNHVWAFMFIPLWTPTNSRTTVMVSVQYNTIQRTVFIPQGQTDS